MSVYKTTANILNKPWEDELFNQNLFDTDTPWQPPTQDWSYDREIRLEDVDIWEVLYESSGGVGIYAAWLPYAEFYMITTGVKPKPSNDDKVCYRNWTEKYIEFYNGSGAQQKVYKRAKELGINLTVHKTWVDDDKLWLYQSK
jgi:hypothetical protein